MVSCPVTSFPNPLTLAALLQLLEGCELVKILKIVTSYKKGWSVGIEYRNDFTFVNLDLKCFMICPDERSQNKSEACHLISVDKSFVFWWFETTTPSSGQNIFAFFCANQWSQSFFCVLWWICVCLNTTRVKSSNFYLEDVFSTISLLHLAWIPVEVSIWGAHKLWTFLLAIFVTIPAK